MTLLINFFQTCGICRVLDVTTLAVPESARDWTFTTHYAGTVGRVGDAVGEVRPVRVEPCSERIDLAVLRRPDPILWNATIVLFEDELDDNGVAQYSVKAVSLCSVAGALFLRDALCCRQHYAVCTVAQHYDCNHTFNQLQSILLVLHTSNYAKCWRLCCRSA